MYQKMVPEFHSRFNADTAMRSFVKFVLAYYDSMGLDYPVCDGPICKIIPNKNGTFSLATEHVNLFSNWMEKK